MFSIANIVQQHLLTREINLAMSISTTPTKSSPIVFAHSLVKKFLNWKNTLGFVIKILQNVVGPAILALTTPDYLLSI